MAHFAEIGLDNLVQQVIVVNNTELLDENGLEQEALGQQFCRQLLGGTWIQTSYNAQFRKNFAGVGYTYDSQRDAFIPPQLYPSWVLEDATCQWQAPTPLPEDGNQYTWNEAAQSWTQV